MWFSGFDHSSSSRRWSECDKLLQIKNVAAEWCHRRNSTESTKSSVQYGSHIDMGEHGGTNDEHLVEEICRQSSFDQSERYELHFPSSTVFRRERTGCRKLARRREIVDYLTDRHVN